MITITSTLLLLSAINNAIVAAEGAKPRQLIILTNPTATSRFNEVISLQRNRLGKQPHQLLPIVYKANKMLITQTIDNNNDGQWDELLVEVLLKAHAVDTVQIKWVTKAQFPAFTKSTNVQLSLRSKDSIATPEINHTIRYRGFTQNIAQPFYQMEGPGIENDKIAFRAFFDYRNGKDIYGKIVDEPILQKVGLGASWHQMQYWGKDILKVGKSLGAGALAVQENNSIYPLADADTASFEVLYEGPLRAAFKLNFKNWNVGTGKKNGSETISITKGNFFYQNEIIVPLSTQQFLVSGIANFGIDNIAYRQQNASWSTLSTYGQQAEGTNSNLGLAILFGTGQYVAHATTTTSSVIPNTTYVALQPTAKKTIYFFACWQQTDARFATQAGFDNYLAETANRLANPIQINIILKH